ncbi:MAG: type VI secretion system baseplate subunit TssF, partial [Planctomycetota bacterium]
MPERRFKPDYTDDLERYFQDELRYLKDLGKEHADADPTRAHFDFGAVEDPDVLFLLKGFSFLTARIRQRLDDGLPEISHSLLKLLFPHYLRSIPSMSVVEFRPQPGVIQARTTIDRGTSLDSAPVDGEACHFQTTQGVDVLPISIERFRLERHEGRGGTLRIKFSGVGPVDLAKVDMSRVRLFLRDGAEEDRAATLLWVLCTQVSEMSLEWPGPEGPQSSDLEPADAIRHVGLELGEFGDESTELLPFPVRGFAGFRLLQEYFSLPSKFQFVDLILTEHPEGLAFPGAEKLSEFDVALRIDELPGGLPQLDEDMLA